jgi:hypothetical protein
MTVQRTGREAPTRQLPCSSHNDGSQNDYLNDGSHNDYLHCVSHNDFLHDGSHNDCQGGSTPSSGYNGVPDRGVALLPCSGSEVHNGRGGNAQLPHVDHDELLSWYLAQLLCSGAAGLLADTELAISSIRSSLRSGVTDVELPDSSLAQLPYNGRTVSITGLPFSCSPSQLLGLFAGLDFEANTIYYGRNTQGVFSGQAWLAFATQAEALSAIAQNYKHHGSRRLEMTLQ